jgi:hypothetical protein
VREDLRNIEKPVNRILRDATMDPEEKQDQVALKQYVHSSAKALAAKVSRTTSTLGSSSTNSSEVVRLSTENDVFYGSFDEWLASFTPDTKSDETTPEQRLEFMREHRKKVIGEDCCPDKHLEHNMRNPMHCELDPPEQKMRLLIQGLRKKDYMARYSETIEVDPDSLTFELLETLFRKVCVFPFLVSKRRPF